MALSGVQGDGPRSRRLREKGPASTAA